MKTSNSPAPLEIERKYLIRMPQETVLQDHAARRIDMVQTYLTADDSGYGRRVRMSDDGCGAVYTYTAKRKVSELVREEIEREIARDEYMALLNSADQGLNPIVKTRWCIPCEGHILEIDIYPFWEHTAVLEVELSAENESFFLPGWLGAACEVTGDAKYLNISLARIIPPEPDMSIFAD